MGYDAWCVVRIVEFISLMLGHHVPYKGRLLADYGITDKTTVLLYFDMHYIGTWSHNNRMLQRTVTGYFTVTSKLMFAESEINVPNLHYAVHILI